MFNELYHRKRQFWFLLFQALLDAQKAHKLKCDDVGKELNNSAFYHSGMGTKVEYSINLLAATSADSKNLTVKGVDVWEHYQNKGLSNKGDKIGTNKLQFPMERMLDRNNVEFIRNTMQMHEDIFKQQVQELHRVYSVQKMLMDELNKEIRQTKLWNPINGEGISQPQTIQIPNGAADFQAQSLRDDVYLRERSTGSCSGEDVVTKMPRGFDLEMPAEEGILTGEYGFDEGEAGPSSYTAIQGGSDEEMEVDLTLSIGGNNDVKKKKKNTKPHVLELTRKLNFFGSFKSDRVGECSDPTTPMSSSSVTFEQERKEPHWLSQGLKLK